MGHVTFIHGIMNQPSPAALLDTWKRELADGGDGLDLDVHGVTSSMVYWADVMYAAASDSGQIRESIGYEGIAPGSLVDIDESYVAAASGDERAFIETMMANYDLDRPGEADAVGETGSEPAPGDDAKVAAASALEAVPLPWFVKRPLMRVLLRDVHHYLFNTSHSPRPDATFKVRDEVRRRFGDGLGEVVGRPHVVVAHSLGSVIAYDCLKRVAGTPNIDLLVTVGTPLGVSEVRHNLRPEWSRDDGFPGALPRWVNVVDRLDPVCAAVPLIANDYRRNREEVVEDRVVDNGGVMRHPVGKYLRQGVVQDALRQGLGL
jgi:hypothetical protein